jgi:hypothetical protein
MSASSLEKNGQILSSKRTKHIKAKYFLIKDYSNAEEVDLRYCPTGRMWADVLTKPLQGQMFRDMRAFLQNCSRDYDDNLERQQYEQAHQSTKKQVKLFLHCGVCWSKAITLGRQSRVTQERCEPNMRL